LKSVILQNKGKTFAKEAERDRREKVANLLEYEP
jgi:hypothetical protein